MKNALFNKNDATTMAEELRLALAECEANTFEPQVQASNDAQSYLLAHRAAFEACEVERSPQSRSRGTRPNTVLNGTLQ